MMATRNKEVIQAAIEGLEGRKRRINEQIVQLPGDVERREFGISFREPGERPARDERRRPETDLGCNA